MGPYIGFVSPKKFKPKISPNKVEKYAKYHVVMKAVQIGR